MADLPAAWNAKTKRAARHRGARATRTACSRTSTGRGGSSATSPPTRSATSPPRSSGRRSAATLPGARRAARRRRLRPAARLAARASSTATGRTLEPMELLRRATGSALDPAAPARPARHEVPRALPRSPERGAGVRSWAHVPRPAHRHLPRPGPQPPRRRGSRSCWASARTSTKPFYVGFSVAGYELALDPAGDPANVLRVTYWGVADADLPRLAAPARRRGAGARCPVQDVGDGIRSRDGPTSRRISDAWVRHREPLALRAARRPEGQCEVSDLVDEAAVLGGLVGLEELRSRRPCRDGPRVDPGRPV